MRLMNIHIQNFKGIEELKINAAGSNLDIYGPNGSGKSSIMDAYLWCLTGKDSGDRKDFGIKPLDAGGQVKDHKAITTVSVSLDQFGELTTLRKEYREKWTKRHGAAAAEFTGNETRYYVDDLEVKSKRFEDAVSDLCDRDIFKLLSSPLHFNQIDWKDRRRILFALAGELPDDVVIAGEPELAPLLQMKGKHNIDDFKRICTDRRKAANSQIDDNHIQTCGIEPPEARGH